MRLLFQRIFIFSLIQINASNYAIADSAMGTNFNSKAATPDYTAYQGYLNADTALDARYAWSLGIEGSGITLHDIEYHWNIDHEDFAGQDVSIVRPQVQNYDGNHGTSVFGIVMAARNGYGVDGIAPKASARGYSVMAKNSIFDAEGAVELAIQNSKPGDVILFEIAEKGPDNRSAPLDVRETIWDLVKKATDAGITVVQAGGNNAANLDAAAYNSYHARGDNGSIIVGSGSPNRLRTGTAGGTHGKRVNLHGWGSKTFALGKGDFNRDISSNDPNRYYTANFGGTSGSAAMVAGAAILIQNYAQTKLGKTLTSREIRELLVATGLPQGKGDLIGPFPNIRNAIEKLNGSTFLARPLFSKKSPVEIEYASGSLLVTLPEFNTHKSMVELFDLKGQSQIRLIANKGKYIHIPLSVPIARGDYFLKVNGNSYRWSNK